MARTKKMQTRQFKSESNLRRVPEHHWRMSPSTGNGLQCGRKCTKRKAHVDETSNPASDNHASASFLDAVDATVRGSYAAPAVVICPPEESDSSPNGNTDTLSTSLATLSLANPTGSLMADTTMAFPTPSDSEAWPSLLVPAVHPPHTMASFNPDCSSADLHSSFALQMNTSCETSFDLLNDKISFLETGYEESFDMGRDLVPIPEKQDLEEAGENAESPNVDTEPCLDPSSSNDEVLESDHSDPPPAIPPVQLSDVALESLNTVSQHSDVSAIPLRPAIAPPPHAVFVAPPVKPCSPTPVLLTTLPEPPALIPALKIVKRKRPETTTVAQKANNPLPEPVPPAADKSASSSVVKINNPLPKPDPPATKKSASSSVQSTGQYVMEGPGPRRVPISSNHKEKEVVAAKSQKTVAGSALSGPRRVPLRNTSPIPGVAATPAATNAPSQPHTAVKRPLRTGSGNGPVSGLPRAVNTSRLPMPKSKIPPPTAGTGLSRRNVVG
ncbi:J domain-containing protein [Mycena sanguinolenta]|uniref:J domain-containing protein n=1 Tax=Mycena sanguinolenta TaxID=230812 RepID=A0A8H6XAG7_9AGAR|nr:J domain-containing protein [Mycena sanguinolenta]